MKKDKTAGNYRRNAGSAKAAAVFLLFAALGPARAEAAEAKPVWKWVAASEYYFILPAAQDLRFDGGGTASVKPWGFGIRAVGHEAFSKTAALQLQTIKVDKPGFAKDTIYLLELLVGMDYMTPKEQGKPLRFTAGAFADLGFSDSTLYAAPVLSAGLLYTTSDQADTPNGLTFNLLYRLTDIDLDNAGSGRPGTLKPSLGFKIGYVFEGFWTEKKRGVE